MSTANHNKSEYPISTERNKDYVEKLPYEHQIYSWNCMTKHYNDLQKKCGIVVVPTGGGKTFIASRWLLENHVKNNGKVLWFAHRATLLKQALDTFLKEASYAQPKTKLRLGLVFQEGLKWSMIDKDFDIVLSSMQSASLNTEFVFDFINEANNNIFIVIDEAHHTVAPSYLKILHGIRERKLNYNLLGLTATPTRMSEKERKRLWNEYDGEEGIICQVKAKDLISKGILAEPIPVTVKTNISMERDFTEGDIKYLQKFGELAPRVLDRLAKHAHRNKLIVDHYLENKEIYTKTIIFAANVDHAYTLSQEFNKNGIKASNVDYTVSNAESIIESFRKNSDPLIISNVEMLTEGFDAPDTQTIFLARPTKSESLLSQMIGRGLRGPKAKGTEKAYLVTFIDTWQRFPGWLDASIIVSKGEVGGLGGKPSLPVELVAISKELVDAAYELVKSVYKGSFDTIYKCLPYGWYTWEEEINEGEEASADIIREKIIVFENQKTGFDSIFNERFPEGKNLPDMVDISFAYGVLADAFGSSADPLPNPEDILKILNRLKNVGSIDFFTFEEKNKFNTKTIAEYILKNDFRASEQTEYIQKIYDENPVIAEVYGGMKDFEDEISKEIIKKKHPINKPWEEEIELILLPDEKADLKKWPEGSQGYNLITFYDSLCNNSLLFSKGGPRISGIEWSRKPIKNIFGRYRVSDKKIIINKILNSPDVPEYVLDELMYHEMLHADMPYSGHDSEFKRREKIHPHFVEASKFLDTMYRKYNPEEY